MGGAELSRERAGGEMAGMLIYRLYLANRLGADLDAAVTPTMGASDTQFTASGVGPGRAPYSGMVAPLATTPSTSRRMSRQARRDTKPELDLRKLLHARGLRYRVNEPLPGLPRRRSDLTFGPARVVVLVDGCFWHGCPIHATNPATNAEWWAAKLTRNVERDRETDRHLEQAGWLVLRFWEHEDMVRAADAVEEAVRRRRPRSAGPSRP